MNADTGLHRLPDGSGFFTATIGRRPPGFLYWLMARPNGSCRRWLYLWRNFQTARTGFPATHPPLPFFRALRWAWSVS